MNRTQKISFWKSQQKAASELRDVAIQNLNVATRLESAAKSALEELGVPTGRARKGQTLSEESRMALLARMSQ